MKSTIIGIGLMGTNLVNCAMKNLKADISYLTINDDPQANECSFAENKILLCATNTIDGVDKVRIDTSASRKIWSIIAESNAVLLVLGAAGHLASDIMSDLVMVFNKTNAFKMCIPVMPFIFEGKKRYEHAEETVDGLKEFFNSVHIISNEKESAEYRGTIKRISEFSELLVAIDKKIVGIISSIIEQMQSII